MTMWFAIIVGIVCAAAPAGFADDKRRIEIRGEWFYVNGEAFLVKGVGYSPSRPGQLPWTSTLSPDVMAEDFAKIREAGFNTIRTWAPLSREQLALARQHDLMVLQGIWVNPRGNYLSDTFQTQMLQIINQEVSRVKEAGNVLAVLVGNELLPERVFLAGVAQTDALLKRAYEAVKNADPKRLVSYANWPQLSALDLSVWDLVCMNLYPYEPSSVAHSLTFRGYIEYLKRTVAKTKPLVITELGLSVSPKPSAHPRPGYGDASLTPEQQAQQVLSLWDQAYQAGAQGACIFEWNDEWWKQHDYEGDERRHDENDPEEWFGMVAFEEATQTTPAPRPLFHALKAYNQAVVISPVSDENYEEAVPVAVYAEEAVHSIRVRVGKQKWRSAAQVSKHWWKAQVALGKISSAKHIRVIIEARGAKGKTLVKHERVIWAGMRDPARDLTITTDQDRYEVDGKLVPLKFLIEVHTDGKPVAGQEVFYSVTEPQDKTDHAYVSKTDEAGRISTQYLLREPGLVTLAAGTAPDQHRATRRVGTEKPFIVERKAQRPAEAVKPHQPSMWEQRAAGVIGKALSHPEPSFTLFDPGSEDVVEYARYGRFQGVGTTQYRYEILDREGLASAVGEGIYPNEYSVLRDPAYQRLLRAKKLEGSVWDYTHHADAQLAFFKWADSSEESGGVKQFFTATALERAGLLQAAAKAYYAVVIHFPEAVGWTEFQTPWYVGVTARDKLEALLREHPELGMRLVGAKITIERGFDNDVDNDIVTPYPGRLVQVSPEDVNPPSQDLSHMATKRVIGKGRVQLRQYENGHWRLEVGGKPWVVRGLSYSVAAVGESHDEGTFKDWMTADRNGNKVLDSFETFVDANRNNKHEPNEPVVGDFKLMKDAGINTLRLYHHAANKPLLAKLHQDYGFMMLMGDLVGMYTVGSGAKWEDGTDYLDPAQRKRMTQSVRQMVREYKDEPYVLMWVLGNENNYGGVHGIVGGRGNAAQHPKEFYQFLNELAEWIHKEDPDHPVAISNGEWLHLDVAAAHAPAIDVFGANLYRGAHGFGRSFYEAVQSFMDKPVLITEYGCPAYNSIKPREGDRGQMLYHFGNWIDLEDNMAGRGTGNALGGVLFEWVDEWWKAGQPPRYSPKVQETTPNWSGPFQDGKNYEEWYGVTSQGDGSHSPFLRQLRQAYELYQALWTSN